MDYRILKKGVIMKQAIGYGYIPSQKDLRDYRINKTYKSIQLPTEFICKHSHIKDQGYVGSCVAHAISEVLEAKDGVNYSTGWIYGYRPDGYYQGEGMMTSQALKTVRKVGYIINDKFNYNVEVPEAQKLVNEKLDQLKEWASERKIVSYARLYGLNEIKQALYNSNKPVLVAISCDETGLNLDENNVALIPTKPRGGHQLVCYGWNETGLLMQNSWGENWGDKGTFILPYEYEIEEAWIINFEGEQQDTQVQIVKPTLYWLRKIIQKIIKWLLNGR